MSPPTQCLILLSGGQDSTTVALQAKTRYEDVHALTIHYGQRHEIEVESALAVGKALRVASHEIIELGNVLTSTSPLVSNNSVDIFARSEDVPEGVANTFIPSRNALFLTLASNRAIALGISTVGTGVCECDYSGYPDCRRVFIDALEEALSLGNFGEKGKFKILTPLMFLTKAESVKLAQNLLGVEEFKKMFELTHTCYQGIKGGCGHCAACLLRDKGFIEAGVNDPIWKFREA
ncbi:MAG: 7-cyano-7-deazaguanine synthase QueC [Leptolyngbyaceae cyanobacterium CSU_1_4]|nr:7-cyano-7-deazaguanine synthase QueC [Leptolyngbyaceae cyanobacterium CSU_1_4]